MFKPTLVLSAAALLALPGHAALIGWQAENGASTSGTVTVTLGADFDPPVNAQPGALGDAYITSESDGGGNQPGTAARVASYDITFTEAGTYDLYGRLYFAGAGDDSLFAARFFGVADPTADTAPIPWGTINGLAVTSTTNQWVWVNLSQNTGDIGEAPATYTVGSAGTLTYQIGARENGMLIDALAFGTTGETFTDQQLDASVVPEPGSLALLGLGALAMVRRQKI